MDDSLTILDMFARGIAVGAMGVTGLSFLASGVSRHARVATSLISLSLICWLITESGTLWPALGHFYPLVIPAYGVAGLFWLFVVTVFEDRPLTLASWSPAAILFVTGFICEASHPPFKDWLWASRNIFGGLLSLHAAYVVAKGWSGDLLEARRRLRAVVLGLAALFSVTNVAIALVYRIYPHGPWLEFTAGRPYGGAIFAALMVASGTLFLQARPAVFGGQRRSAPVADARAETAERLLLQKLIGFMGADGWRREGLTIGEVARQLGEPEHRLRRLINQRLGHRNFADFVNSYRIDAAKRRLADPQDARTTIAAIAFDLGYGSLGPFNRAFRAATGATPSAWRRQALQASPDLQEAV
ncbi:MAG: helix-turn-helix domain-containing protein [Alphaproteobacteria bacterium]|nr:helix-turn-helix domain-containing protein [Alphaproteobacteria bacterium]MBU1516167.1 helix-turn-helix domain-containing protein [Alphaproteobacteria bacterium]MBU2097116.1 helix-turn-helix domain-containing protein [Alphaproteobacteria bacterium]MBU2151564.1 helix-turn-helix domain-containing protein [Alphaproteobacteria bacterium]MBU2309685.1 helix-turn-helix domain-containing protein [Alphaproteobacteria bacterium]